MRYPATPPPLMFPEQRPARKRWLFIWIFAMALFISVVILFAGFAGLRATRQTFIVNGTAMQPTFHDGQSIQVNRLAYLFQKPQRGDIVVFHVVVPTQNICEVPLPIAGEPLLKRIVGIPGDTITNTATSLNVNGKALYTTTAGNNFAPISNLKLGNNQYFVLGDNQAVSLDSRCLGPITLDTIIGNVV